MYDQDPAESGAALAGGMESRGPTVPSPQEGAPIAAGVGPDRASDPGAPRTVATLWLSPFGWLLVASLVVLWLARDVIGPFVVAGVIAYAFGPLVTAAERRTGLPRIVVVAVGYVAALAIVAVLVAVLAERLAAELLSLGATGPDAIGTTIRQLVGGDTIAIGGQQISVAAIADAIQARLGALVASPGDAVHAATVVAQFGLDTVLALIVAFYLLLDAARFRARAIDLMPESRRATTVALLERIHVVLGKWLRGQLLLIALVALVVYVGLGPILHLPYALAIAVVTGVLEVLPLVGPAIATVIAGTDAFTHGGAGVAAAVVIFYFVLRQVEDQVVMPVVIGRAVHLHPVVTIFAVLVGLSTFGILGGVLGVPVAAAANVVFNEAFPDPEPAATDPAEARARDAADAARS